MLSVTAWQKAGPGFGGGWWSWTWAIYLRLVVPVSVSTASSVLEMVPFLRMFLCRKLRSYVGFVGFNHDPIADRQHLWRRILTQAGECNFDSFQIKPDIGATPS